MFAAGLQGGGVLRRPGVLFGIDQQEERFGLLKERPHAHQQVGLHFSPHKGAHLRQPGGLALRHVEHIVGGEMALQVGVLVGVGGVEAELRKQGVGERR